MDIEKELGVSGEEFKDIVRMCLAHPELFGKISNAIDRESFLNWIAGDETLCELCDEAEREHYRERIHVAGEAPETATDDGTGFEMERRREYVNAEDVAFDSAKIRSVGGYAAMNVILSRERKKMRPRPIGYFDEYVNEFVEFDFYRNAKGEFVDIGDGSCVSRRDYLRYCAVRRKYFEALEAAYDCDDFLLGMFCVCQDVTLDFDGGECDVVDSLIRKIRKKPASFSDSKRILALYDRAKAEVEAWLQSSDDRPAEWNPDGLLELGAGGPCDDDAYDILNTGSLEEIGESEDRDGDDGRLGDDEEDYYSCYGGDYEGDYDCDEDGFACREVCEGCDCDGLHCDDCRRDF